VLKENDPTKIVGKNSIQMLAKQQLLLISGEASYIIINIFYEGYK